MKIHLSAWPGRRKEIADVAARLERIGHDVTSRWIEGRSNPAVNGHFDLTDVALADAMVVFGDDPNRQLSPYLRGGRHVEFGYALRANKRLYRVGPAESVFHDLERVITFEDIEKMVRYFSVVDLLGHGRQR